MKKYLIALMLLVITSGAFAQSFSDGEGSQHIGINAGFSANPLRERNGIKDEKLSLATRPYGFKIGAVYETTIIKGFGLQMGLNYTFGANIGKWSGDQNSSIKKTREEAFYQSIELPIDWQYKFEIAKKTYLILYTGPTLQAGLTFKKKTFEQNINPANGKIETFLKGTKDFYSKELDSDHDDNYDYQRFNITWGVGAGFQYKQYYLRGGYDFGIINPYHDPYFNTDADNSYRNRGRQDQWSLKLGIYIWNF